MAKTIFEEMGGIYVRQGDYLSLIHISSASEQFSLQSEDS